MDYPLFMVPRYLMGIVILNVLSFICGAILLLVGLFIETNRHFAYDLFSKAFPMSFMAFVLCAAALFLLCMDLTHYRGFFVINSGQIICFGFVICLICSLEFSAFVSSTILRDYVFKFSIEAVETEIQIYPENRLNASFRDSESAHHVPLWIDTLQSSFSCCGARSWMDWQYRFANMTVSTNASSPTGPGEFILPFSCCRKSQNCQRNVSIDAPLSSSIFAQPCLPLVRNVLDRDSFTYGLVCISIFVFQVCSLLLTCLLNRRGNDRSIYSM